VEASEEYADGRIRRKNLIEMRERARQDDSTRAQSVAMAASRPKIAASWVAILAALDPNYSSPQQCHHLRDLFSPLPFRPISINLVMLSWNDGTVPKIAQAIYDERAFDRMPILADALEEAGCTDAEILNHCRQPGEHVRGCWVVDLLLGKS
jgi:hypothetical protein